MNRTSRSFRSGGSFVQRCSRAAAVFAAAGYAPCAFSQVPMEPVGAVLRYEVSAYGSPWSSAVAVWPGHRVEWRAVVSFTGTQNAVALGTIYYHPVLSNIDNVGSGAEIDSLGVWRNNGISGQGTTTLQQGLLSLAEGESTDHLPSYGRVHFGFSSRSTLAGNSGGLTGHRHSAGSGGAPAGDFIRIAGTASPNWYPSSIPVPNPDAYAQLLWGVVSNNPSPQNTWFVAGTQNLVVLRQVLGTSTDYVEGRTITINSEAATLRRAGGSLGTDDTRFMTWAQPGESGLLATIRVGVEYHGATITFLPSPGAIGILSIGGVLSLRKRHRISK